MQWVNTNSEVEREREKNLTRQIVRKKNDVGEKGEKERNKGS